MNQTQELRLVQGDTELLKLAIQGKEALAARLGVTVPEIWTEFPEALEYSKDQLTLADQAGWWTYFPIHKETNTLIGSGGYKGKPDEHGTVELGYEIVPDYRNKGLATEFCRALVENAFSDQRVTKVIAHTLPDHNGSTKVLTKCGFTKTEVIDDPDDGIVWRWERDR